MLSTPLRLALDFGPSLLVGLIIKNYLLIITLASLMFLSKGGELELFTRIKSSLDLAFHHYNFFLQYAGNAAPSRML